MITTFNWDITEHLLFGVYTMWSTRIEYIVTEGENKHTHTERERERVSEGKWVGE